VAATIETRTSECSIVTVERQLAAVIGAQVPMPEIPPAERTMRAKLDAAIASLDVGPLGAAFTLWRPPVDGRMDMQPGILVARTFEPVGEVCPQNCRPAAPPISCWLAPTTGCRRHGRGCSRGARRRD